ncbi:MAG TPA: DUF2924 domain-containing protein [Devosia sp.]|nr:DUF2924 domain-containing protein [Devosia sp.]
MKRPTAEKVEREIAALDTVDFKALQNRWRELFKIEPPRHIRSGFLRRAIAYRLQELVYGGLKPAARRQLKLYAEQARARRGMTGEPADGAKLVPAARNRVVLSPGTRLMREWNGVTQVVEVSPDRFVWRGKPYRTLSAVAGAITGTRWSGPKFFGLAGPARSATKLTERSLVRSLAVDGGAGQ